MSTAPLERGSSGAARPTSPHCPSALDLTEEGRGRPWCLGDTGTVRLHHRWDDDEDRPEPDLNDPVTAAALIRAARDVRVVKLVHLALLVVGIGLLALALLLRAG